MAGAPVIVGVTRSTSLNDPPTHHRCDGGLASKLNVAFPGHAFQKSECDQIPGRAHRVKPNETDLCW